MELKKKSATAAPPNPRRMIQALRQIGYSLEQSIADLVDNSINAKAQNVLIRFVTEGEKISSIIVADDGRDLGFKAGYAATENRYYSWLGGVTPTARGRGVADALMQAQHTWVKDAGFERVETHVREDNTAMVSLNRKAGLDVVGRFIKAGKPNLMMQKVF